MARLTSWGHGAAAWMTKRSDDTSYLRRTSAGSLSRRMNMVGTMNMVSRRSRSISSSSATGSKRGISTITSPTRPARMAKALGAE